VRVLVAPAAVQVAATVVLSAVQTVSGLPAAELEVAAALVASAVVVKSPAAAASSLFSSQY